MTIVEMARVTSKGQVTIPSRIRKILKVSAGSSVAFGLSKDGVVLLPCKITAESPYSQNEWEKIEKFASIEGKIHKDEKKAKNHIPNL